MKNIQNATHDKLDTAGKEINKPLYHWKLPKIKQKIGFSLTTMRQNPLHTSPLYSNICWQSLVSLAQRTTTAVTTIIFAQHFPWACIDAQSFPSTKTSVMLD